ncbi:MAG: hypothetical protein GY765_05195 [bacterium]|nr:hypothetical protein [bacterium]
MQHQVLYSVIFEGKIRQGEDAARVKARLGKLFRLDAAKTETLFHDVPRYVRRNLSRAKALEYKVAFEKSGALCLIVQETVTQSPPPPPSPQTAPGTYSPETPGTGREANYSIKPNVAENQTGKPVVFPPPIPSAQPGPHPQTAGGTTPSQGVNSPSHGTPPNPQQPPIQAPNRFGIDQTPQPVHPMNKEVRKTLGIGFGISVVVLYLPFLSFIFRYLITLAHEIGHAIFGWLYGYPSIPAFDFAYGGGVTMHQDRKLFIVIIVYILLAALLYMYRGNRLTLGILIGGTALYSLTAFTSLHSMIILFMGHGTELIFGGICFYRALSGSAVVVAAERPLYAFLGFFIFFSDCGFAFRLMTSKMFRADYEAAKGGGHWMDFSRIAEEYLDVRLATVALFFLLLCLLMPVATYLFYRKKEGVFGFLGRLLEPE